MLGFVFKRILSMVAVLAIVGAVAYAILFLTPGDPAAVLLGQEASDPQALHQMRHRLGLDQSFPVQLVQFYGRLLRLDLGTSIFSQEPVAKLLIRDLEPTLVLTGLAIGWSVAVGVPMGIGAAVHRNTLVDQVLTVLATLGISMPNFWLGLNLVVLFAIIVPLFPAQGFQPLSAGVAGAFRYMVLPSLALGAPQVALVARMTRSSMLDVLSMDFVRTATSKGVPRRSILYKHALLNTAPTVLPVIALSIALLLGGTVVVEQVFNIHGIGQLVTSAIQRRDYPVVRGAVLLLAGSYAVISTLLDIGYAFLDPRIRFS